MSGRHNLDLNVEELLTAITLKCGGELTITVEDALRAKGLKLAINPGESELMLKTLTLDEAKLMAAGPPGSGKH